MKTKPVVTAVIPTRNRPNLVCNAVRSALNQTYGNVEVIVVIDGQDSLTRQSLYEFVEERVRVVELSEHRGGAYARNEGVAAACGEWIAFLDDDDEWVPTKLEVQSVLAAESSHPLPIVSSRFIARTPEAEFVWPRRVLRRGENISDYLFNRKSLFQGEGYLATPTLLAKRELLLRLPLRPFMKKHEDWDWVLRAAALPDVGFEFSPEPLAIVRMGSAHRGVTNHDDWQFSLGWIKDRRQYVSSKAYSAFILTVVADQASRGANLRDYLTLGVESWKNGQPSPLHLALYGGMRIFPRHVRHQLRQLLTAKA